ncbi:MULTISPECIES: helix-hairpin-helix domain-containing protein [Haloferax]|uniref:Helix-hairpin-helix DNA-binding motif class 1 domain-containing protein n=1 Tax=Haloferax marinum TaxID=2666143 RepID=A0A6A8G9V7_9EURY|nr:MULTISPECIES: helix-hairpin-helix domain-containing protein [Haloferax]KAB1197996.1 hypothetical protein Hfx1150_10885 [Haloferax sp. CBA1150]MRW97063.1 hypothetical protein [Haloferax marinum]
MRQPTRLIRDSAERHKLKVSLPGGRYQLSLDDRAVIVLTDELGLSVRDEVPTPFVPFFIAMGDAWFPRQRDVDSVIRDLPSEGSLTAADRDVLVSYVTDSLIAERREKWVLAAIENSPIADQIDSTDLRINKLPEPPKALRTSKKNIVEDSVEHTERQRPTKRDEVAEVEPRTESDTTDQQKPESSAAPKEEAREALQEIPGIGPHRAKQLAEGGVHSLAALADARPVDLAGIDGITEDIATVAVEGAREVLGHTVPASDRLTNQTGVSDDVFSPALSSLAASGVPASEATPTLRVLYGPTVADIDAVSGQQAYFLWEAGYQTPHDVLEASPSELTDVYQVGSTTAAEIQESARSLLERRRD